MAGQNYCLVTCLSSSIVESANGIAFSSWELDLPRCQPAPKIPSTCLVELWLRWKSLSSPRSSSQTTLSCWGASQVSSQPHAAVPKNSVTVCQPAKAHHHTHRDRQWLLDAFSERHLLATNESNCGRFAWWVDGRVQKETSLWTISAYSLERSSYASPPWTSAFGVSGIPLLFGWRRGLAGFGFRNFVGIRWTVD